jgi:hypothetical protein
MYHTRKDANLTQQLPIVTVPISLHDKSDDAEVQKLKTATFPLSEEKEVVSDSSSEKTDGWIPATTRYGCTVERKDGAYNPSTGTTIKWSNLMATKVDDDGITEVTGSNYYEVLGIDENEVKVLQEFNDSLSEYLNIGAGIGGGFTNTNELQLMGYHEAINGPDGEKWKEEVRIEHGRMVQSGVFKRVKRSKLPSDVKVINTVWVMKRRAAVSFEEESMFKASNKSRDSITMHRASVRLSQME